jgi:hypothetical protein
MAAGNSTRRVISYPEWQPQYEAALLEPNAAELPRRVQAAEAAILQRLQVVSDSADDASEREAMQNALGALQVLSRESRI